VSSKIVFSKVFPHFSLGNFVAVWYPTVKFGIYRNQSDQSEYTGYTYMGINIGRLGLTYVN